MGQIIFMIMILVSSLISPHPSGADTIVLKSGRTIDATKCWEDGEIIKCNIYGQIVGYHKNDIAEAKLSTKPEIPPADGFKFDIWQSGISVHEAIDVAEVNNIPLHRGGLISVNKTFNPTMCRPYADEAIEFYYKDQILGKWATLTFRFTQSSKRLYSLSVAFSGPGISKKSEFREQVESMLRKKYGKPIRITNHIVYKDFDWSINDNAIVTMRPGGNSVHITYRDLKLTDLCEKEKLNQVRSGFTRNDKSKF